MTTEQKLPEWWGEFCEAVKTRTLDRYECTYVSWADNPREKVSDWVSSIYEDPFPWQFRKKQRTVNINGVELVAPVLAGEVVPRDAIVWSDYGRGRQATGFQNDVLVFTSKSDQEAMRAALLGVKP